MNGQTPAKRILGLRVISIDGRPINAVQATIRNFLRVADIAPVISLEIFSPEMPPAYMIPTFVFALISMVLTRRMQRLGDLAAGTMVVIDEKNWYPKYAKFDDPRVASLAEFIPAEFRLSRTMAQAIALYCDRRIMFSPARRADLRRTWRLHCISVLVFALIPVPISLCALFTIGTLWQGSLAICNLARIVLRPRSLPDPQRPFYNPQPLRRWPRTNLKW